jgi:hypothetical protein
MVGAVTCCPLKNCCQAILFVQFSLWNSPLWKRLHLIQLGDVTQHLLRLLNHDFTSQKDLQCNHNKDDQEKCQGIPKSRFGPGSTLDCEIENGIQIRYFGVGNASNRTSIGASLVVKFTGQAQMIRVSQNRNDLVFGYTRLEILLQIP